MLSLSALSSLLREWTEGGGCVLALGACDWQCVCVCVCVRVCVCVCVCVCVRERAAGQGAEIVLFVSILRVGKGWCSLC